MIKLYDAQMTDALPAIVGRQVWAQAISRTWLELQHRALDAADKSQIYTAIEQLDEPVLDALAVCFKVDWYDTGHSLQTKRDVIANALKVRRTMGTVYAMRTAVETVFPQSEIEEWFDYGGIPSHYQIICNIENAKGGVDVAEITRNAALYKRVIARLDGVCLQVRPGCSMGVSAAVWGYCVPYTSATQYAGTWYRPGTWAAIAGLALGAGAAADAAPVDTPECGTLPDISTHAAIAGMVSGAAVGADTAPTAYPMTGTGVCAFDGGGCAAGDAVGASVAAQAFGFDTPYCGEESL